MKWMPRLASLESKAAETKAETRVKADQFIVDLSKKRDEFECTVKKQVEASEAAWDSDQGAVGNRVEGFRDRNQEIP